MRYYLFPLFFIFPLIAEPMAFSVNEGFPDPYGCYDNGNECIDCDDYDDDGYVDIYDGDVDDTWEVWEDEPIYPGRNTDMWMDELTKPWQ